MVEISSGARNADAGKAHQLKSSADEAITATRGEDPRDLYIFHFYFDGIAPPRDDGDETVFVGLIVEELGAHDLYFACVPPAGHEERCTGQVEVRHGDV